jgi:hypothetical protein
MLDDEFRIPEWREELEARILADPLAYTLFNPFQLRGIENFDGDFPDAASLELLLKGNGTGGTFDAIAIWAACMFVTANPLFARSPFGDNWPKHWRKSARIVSTAEVLADDGPVQEAMSALFPAGRWSQRKGKYGYYSVGETDTGWKWNMMTYDQPLKQFAGANKGLVIFIEPPKKPVFSESMARLRGGGRALIDMTPVADPDSAWVKYEIVDPGKLETDEVGEDGKKVTFKVNIVKGEIHDNCGDCHEGGALKHQDILRTIALWPAEEREARKKGLFMALSGVIYPNWSEANELDELPEYHQECWDKGRVQLCQVIDPHDRKPFATAWRAVFPNDDVITVAEWPNEPYETLRNASTLDVEDYREMYLAFEAELGIPVMYRINDPNFGNTPKAGVGRTIKQLFAGGCRKCNAGRSRENWSPCKHSLYYHDAPDSLSEGHMVVRDAIGNPAEGKRPKEYALKECRNTCIGMRRYAYDENKKLSKGPSIAPEYVYKDFPDLARYHRLSGRARWIAQKDAPRLWTPKVRGGRVRAT